MNTITTKTMTALAFLAMASLVFPVNAGEHGKMVKVLKIDDGDGDPVELKFTGEAGLLDLEDGETRTVTTADGQAVTVTRTGDRLALLTASGKTMELPAMAGVGQHTHDLHREQRRIKIVHKDGADNSQIIIVSPGGLTEQEQATIRQAIGSAGVDKQIVFLGDEMEANIDVDIEVDH